MRLIDADTLIAKYPDDVIMHCDIKAEPTIDAVAVADIIDYCHKCAEVVANLRRKCLDGKSTADLAAYAHFDQKWMMYEIEIPGLIRSMMAEMEE